MNILTEFDRLMIEHIHELRDIGLIWSYQPTLGVGPNMDNNQQTLQVPSKRKKD